MEPQGQCGGRRRRRMITKKRRGGGYGAGQAIAPGALEWKAVPNAAADPKTGAIVPDPALPMGGGRRRKTRKGRKTAKRRTTRRRTMRGGNALVYNAGSVGYGYSGAGTITSGPTDATPYAARSGGAPMNADGVRSA
jgi:hypothetical protein